MLTKKEENLLKLLVNEKDSNTTKGISGNIPESLLNKLKFIAVLDGAIGKLKNIYPIALEKFVADYITQLEEKQKTTS